MLGDDNVGMRLRTSLSRHEAAIQDQTRHGRNQHYAFHRQPCSLETLSRCEDRKPFRKVLAPPPCNLELRILDGKFVSLRTGENQRIGNE